MGEFYQHGYDKSDGEVIHASDDAILFKEEGGEKYWVPKSQIHDNSEVWKKGDVGILIVTEWLARKKGWIDK